MSDYTEMIGQTIIGFALSKDRETLSLQTASGSIIMLETDEGCCSSTWIESIDGEDALLGKIVSVEDIEMPDLGNVPTAHREAVDEVSYYGLRITTDKGRSIIDYRNDSNGYYGGSISVRTVNP